MPDEAKLVLLALLSHGVGEEEKTLLSLFISNAGLVPMKDRTGLMLAKVLPRAS